MIIVKDDLFNREYYKYNKSTNKAEYQLYIWDNDIKKYVGNYNEFIKIDSWLEFKNNMRNKGFIDLEQQIKKGTIRS